MFSDSAESSTSASAICSGSSVEERYKKSKDGFNRRMEFPEVKRRFYWLQCVFSQGIWNKKTSIETGGANATGHELLMESRI